MKQWLLSVKSNKVKYILVFCVVVQLLCTGLCLVNYAQVRKAGDRELSDYSDQLVEAISSDLHRNNTFLETIMLSSSYRKMFLYSNMDWVNAVSRLQETSALCNRQAYTEFYFFASDASRGSFVEAVAVRIPFSQYRQIRYALLEACRGDVRNGVYQLLTLEDGSRILYTLWKYDDYVCGCWLPEETFLKTAYLLYAGTPYRLSLASGSAGLSIPRVEADFSLLVHSLDRTRQLRSTVMALFQAILSLAVTVALAVITNTLNRKLLMPARTLSDILEKYSAAPQSPGIAEGANALDDAAVVLERLGMQVESLSLKLAESELEKQKLNLSFRSLQIRPHFLVNNLAMINGMAQVGELDKIQEMTVRLSDYYRYVLRDITDRVPLELEISHLRNLTEVTQQWNGNTIHTCYQVENAVKRALIPVLLISTFVENSIKHAENTSGELGLEVVCRVHPERPDTLSIQITDNGAGFTEDILSAMANHGQIAQTAGRRIGISNCVRRLELLYGDRAGITLSNRDTGGALVSILLPLEVTE